MPTNVTKVHGAHERITDGTNNVVCANECSSVMKIAQLMVQQVVLLQLHVL